MVIGGKDGMPHSQRSSFDMTVRGQRCSINATDGEIVLCVDRFQVPVVVCFYAGNEFQVKQIYGVSYIGEQGITKKKNN